MIQAEHAREAPVPVVIAPHMHEPRERARRGTSLVEAMDPHLRRPITLNRIHAKAAGDERSRYAALPRTRRGQALRVLTNLLTRREAVPIVVKLHIFAEN